MKLSLQNFKLLSLVSRFVCEKKLHLTPVEEKRSVMLLSASGKKVINIHNQLGAVSGDSTLVNGFVNLLAGGNQLEI